MSDIGVILASAGLVAGVASISYMMNYVYEKYRLTMTALLSVIWGCYGYAIAMTIEGDITLWWSMKVGLLLLFGWILLVGATIDMRYHILPDIGAFLLLVGGVVYAMIESIPLVERLGMAMMITIVFYGLHWLSRDGFGLGDVKWLGAISLWYTPEQMGMVVLFSFTCGSLLIGLMRLWTSSIKGIPFGPCIAIASLLTMVQGSFWIETWMLWVCGLGI